MLKQIFGLKKDADNYEVQSKAIYDQLLNAISQEGFYEKYNLDPSVDVAIRVFFLYLSLVMIFLKHHVQDFKRSQAIFDYCFKGIESSYLENGASDYSIGHKMKKAIKFFYGGLANYEIAIIKGDEKALAEAIRKNIFVKQKVDHLTLTLFVKNVDQIIGHLKNVDWEVAEQQYFL